MNHEREFDRSHIPTASRASELDVAPNRETRSALLDAPAHPIVSGLLQRQARDGNGVAVDAEHAVAAASSSSGVALPDTLMRKFEASLGADLSSVRIHTGEASAGAAQAVGAKAYTMGQDIHFGAGHYDPSGNEHLIAHEVAHTVQQRGGSPIRQHKLEVSSPGDHLEHEADRAADAMLSGRSAMIAAAPVSAARSIYRDPDNESVADAITPDTRIDTQKAVNQWQQKANQCVIETCAWYSDNIGHFLSLTSSNPRLAWTDGKLFGALASVTGMAISKATTGLAVASLGATIGAAGGPPGMIAGFIIGKVAGMVTDEILTLIKGPNQVAANNAAAAGQAVNASAQRFFQEATQGQAMVSAVFNNAQKNLNDAQKRDVAFRIRDWAMTEISAAKPPPKGDRSLCDRMYSEWSLEHTSFDRLRGLAPGSGVDQAQWMNARRDAKPIDGKPMEHHIDLFGHQTRGFLGRMGLSTEAADGMIAAAQGATSKNAGALMGRYDGKPLVFHTANPGTLLGFLNSYINVLDLMDPRTPKDITDGNITVTVTPHLAIFAAIDAGGEGALVARNFTVHATLPDRQTHQSKDPMDAGRPPVDFGTGKPRSYNVGTIEP